MLDTALGVGKMSRVRGGLRVMRRRELEHALNARCMLSLDAERNSRARRIGKSRDPSLSHARREDRELSREAVRRASPVQFGVGCRFRRTQASDHSPQRSRHRCTHDPVLVARWASRATVMRGSCTMMRGSRTRAANEPQA
jgi:hypothetical protein